MLNTVTVPTYKFLSLAVKFGRLHENVEIGNNSKGQYCLCQPIKTARKQLDTILNASLSFFFSPYV